MASLKPSVSSKDSTKIGFKSQSWVTITDGVNDLGLRSGLEGGLRSGLEGMEELEAEFWGSPEVTGFEVDIDSLAISLDGDGRRISFESLKICDFKKSNKKRKANINSW